MTKNDLFFFGVDISSYPSLRQDGVSYFDIDGNKKDLLTILNEAGITRLRMRLFVNPYSREKMPYGGGNNSLELILPFAKEAQNAGFSLILDLHYSDFWADPGKQILPKSWQDLSYTALLAKIYEYTKKTLLTFNQNGVTFEYIQVGNEITNGILWPHAKLYDEGELVVGAYQKLAALLNEGLKAINEVSPHSKKVIHLDRGGDKTLYETWFKNMIKLLLPFDVIALSYYPYWHGTLLDLENTINYLKAHYNYEIIIMETSYAFSAKKDNAPFVVNETLMNKDLPYPFTVEGQNEYLKALFSLGYNTKIHGIMYWEPAWLLTPESTWATKEGMAYINETHKETGNEWANQALFSFDGVALPSLYAYLNFKEER